MEVTIKFAVDSLEDIQPALVRGGDQLVRSLQSENQRLRDKVAALERVVGSQTSEEPVEGEKDSEGTLFDPTVHTGSKTVKGVWRRKRGSGEKTEPSAETVEAPAAPVAQPKAAAPANGSGPSAKDLASFRDSIKALIGKHADGIEAGKKAARETLLKYGAASMDAVKVEQHAEVLAALKAAIEGASTDGADELDGL